MTRTAHRFLATALATAALAGGIASAGMATATAAGPAVGSFCPGANIGQRTTASNGVRVVCDNYAWTIDRGQAPRHTWADNQR